MVHKGEYVVPQWMVNQYKGLIGSLEGIRNNGFKEGGMVSNKTQNNTINVSGA